MRCALLFSFTAVLAAADVDFAKDVQPVLRKNCFACHGAAMQTSGLRLDQGGAALKGGYGGAAIKPGDAAGSALIARVSGAAGVPVMPPAGARLTADQVKLLRQWIDEGAKYPASAVAEVKTKTSSHWAFQPVRRPAGTIDSLIRAELAKRSIQPSPAADRRVLLRRLSLDLIGLPPTPDELAAFAQDQRKDAYERQVDRLLASPHFGEKWARAWLDQARYADTDGYEKDLFRPYAWRWRNWVIDSINRDQPFDQFTVEQIAGDLLPNGTVEQRVATGFHRNTLFNREGGIDSNQFVFEAKLDRTSTVSSVWLGLTVGCAQCHDHKFDPISQKEMYSMLAFFDNSEEVDIDAPLPGETGPWLRTQAEYRAKRAELLKAYHAPELQADWEKEILYTIAHLGERTDWDLAWDCVQKLTEGGDGGKIVQIPLAQRSERQQEILTDHFAANAHFAYGNKKWKELKLDELAKKLVELRTSFPQLTRAMVLEEDARPHQPSHLRVRGDWKALGIEVQPGTLAVLPPLAFTGAKATRLDLARWLVAKENPLAARVAVNRVWQDLFGAGLVKTPDDFGTRSEAPAYPALLDLLAADFVEKGWSRKELIRLIVTSATYQQSSLARPDLKEIDPQNTLLARQSRLRLPAETIRDATLSAAGLLTLAIGGPSVRPPMPAGVLELSYASRWKQSWAESTGADRYRRGLYVAFLRTAPYPMLANFDAPKSVVAACRRDRSNTALQALNLLNDPVFVEAAQALAQRVLMNGGSAESRLSQLLQLVVGRAPAEAEQRRLLAFLREQQRLLADDAAAIAKLAPMAAPTATRLETATWTMLASAMLNLEEAITRE